MKKFKTIDLILIAMFAALMAVCAWITIPATVPFTLQTMGVFLAIGLLGGKRGSLSVLIYVLLGAVGLPVFSGFKGGLGALLGTTGGYIIGFIASALIMWLIEKLTEKLSAKDKKIAAIISIFSMLIGLIVCYAFGTAWFMVVYANTKEPISLMTCLGWCVFPFVVPDLIKIALAYVLTLRLKRHVPR